MIRHVVMPELDELPNEVFAFPPDRRHNALITIRMFDAKIMEIRNVFRLSAEIWDGMDPSQHGQWDMARGSIRRQECWRPATSATAGRRRVGGSCIATRTATILASTAADATSTSTTTQKAQKQSSGIHFRIIFISAAHRRIFHKFFTVDDNLIVVSTDSHENLTVIVGAIDQALNR
jgi:hypothetical protein